LREVALLLRLLLWQGDGSSLSYLSPQALKQLEKEKIIMEKKKLRQQKRQVCCLCAL